MDRGPTSAMARWRQRRDRGAVSPVADDRSRDATRSEGSNDNTPTEAAGSPRFFEHRSALVAAGDLSASSRWRERLGRASRRERGSDVFTRLLRTPAGPEDEGDTE